MARRVMTGLALAALAALALTNPASAQPAAGRVTQGLPDSQNLSRAEREMRYAGLSFGDAIRQSLIDNDLEFAMTSLDALSAASGDRAATGYFSALRAFTAGEFERAATLAAQGDRKDVMSAGLLAWAELGRGNAEQALKAWTDYGADRAPAFHAAYRGLMAEALGSPGEALQHYKKAQDSGELYFAHDLARRYAVLLAGAGRRDEAVAMLDDVVGEPGTLEADDAEFRAALGRGQAAAPDIAPKAAWSSLIGNFAAGSIVARSMRASADASRVQRGRPEPDADSLFLNDVLSLRSALLADPDNAAARLSLAGVLREAEEPDAALSVLEPLRSSARSEGALLEMAAIRNAQDRPLAGLALIDAIPQARRGIDWWLTRSSLTANAGRFADAAEAARQAVAAARDLSEGQQQRANLSLAATKLELGDAAGALAIIRPLVRDLPRDRLMRGYAGLFMARIASARAEGLEAARQGLDARGVDSGYRASLGSLLAEDAATREEGVQLLRDALAENPRSASMMNNLGYTLVDEGVDPVQGFELLQKAHEARPTSAAIADSFGWAHYKLGEFEEAHRLISLAVSLSEEAPSAEIFDNLGDVSWRLGRHEEARAAWRRSLAIGGHYPEARDLPAKIANGLTTPAPRRRALPVVVEPGST